MRTLDAIVRESGRLLGLEPSVDVGLVAIAHAIGVPSEAAAIFALARCAGWTAHVIEQREAGFLLRPRARYVGP
jgi:citrate synthase